MRSIKLELTASALGLKQGMLLVAVLAISACQVLPGSDAEQTTQEASQEGQRVVDANGDVSQGPVLTSNPYLLDPPRVPRAAKQRFSVAQEALAQREWESAETDLLWLTENYPKLSGPFLNLAQLYAQTERPEEADRYFQQAIAANSNNIGAYDAYGIFLRSQGRFTDAEGIYQQALQLWPHSPNTLINLGVLYDLYMGKLDLALQQYEAYQAIQAEPDRKVQGWVADLKRRLGQ